MEWISVLVVAAAVFGGCFLVDKLFTRLFRSKTQHRSGKAVRANKRYGIFGVVLCVLGIMSCCMGFSGEPVLLWGGLFVVFMGICLAVYYVSFGIFYDDETFLYARFGKADVTYAFREIRGQKLYLIQGGNVVIELHMTDGSTVSVQSAFDGTYPFLDAAFAAWCAQTDQAPDGCDFHDPSQSLWFPTVEDV